MSGVALLLVAFAIWIVRRNRSTPEKRERKRRLAVNLHGRLGDAILTEAIDSILYYCYSVRGVQYTASQDVTTLRDRLPEDLERLIGNVGIKYASNNPANSILVCEEWSGIRPRTAERRCDPAGGSQESTVSGESRGDR